jgi:hypothetical protein
VGTLKVRLIFGVFALLAAATSFADPVVYDFSALSAFIGFVGSFSYTAPGFVTTNLEVPASSLDTCTVLPGDAVCADMEFFVDSSPLEGSDKHDVVGFGAVSGGLIFTSFYYFPNGAFGAPGTYTTVEFVGQQDGLLTVHSVFEPGSVALLPIALAAAYLRLRRRSMR